MKQLYRFQTRRYMPELEDVIFLDQMPDNGQWKFHPTRRQVEAERREIELLERGENEWQY